MVHLDADLRILWDLSDKVLIGVNLEQTQIEITLKKANPNPRQSPDNVNITVTSGWEHVLREIVQSFVRLMFAILDCSLISVLDKGSCEIILLSRF